MSDQAPATKAGASALVAGSVLMIAVFSLRPGGGQATTTVEVWAALFFLVLPAVGVISGVYAFAGGRYGSLLLFAGGSYLGVFGLGLTIIGGILLDGSGYLVTLGLVLFVTATVSTLASLRRLAAFLGLDGTLSAP